MNKELEKRLIKYIKIKIYLRKNKITPDISPEEYFKITQKDLININNFFNKQPKILYNQPIHYENTIYNPSNLNPSINTFDMFLNIEKQITPKCLFDNKTKKINQIYNKQPFEQQYYYIDTDLIKKEHNVYEFPRGGENSRLQNKIYNPFLTHIKY